MLQDVVTLDDVVIKFAGDSGDGIQLTGTQFTNNSALIGNDLSTFPDFPAEIRAPLGTLPGVSGFQLRISSNAIYTPGDFYDVLVVMNAAALKTNLARLKKGGIIIANTAGFDAKNLRLANYPDGENPIENESLSEYNVHLIDITKCTRDALQEISLSTKEKDRAKNMFVLGYLYWMYNRDMNNTLDFLNKKFSKKDDILQSNILSLKAGYNYGITTEVFTSRYEVKKATLPKGIYRNIQGNLALAYGLLSASQKSNLQLFLGSYPITPASDILHELSKHKNFNVISFQAEDEIAAIGSAIGASYGGKLAVTTTSGPGMALKTEAIGLAIMLEIPLLVINIQRGGPSTGLPTKTEQSDLLQAFYGRNGEAPLPIIAAATPSDCYLAIYEASRIAIEHMTPVIFLSDGYIANGSEPWQIVNYNELKDIKVQFANENHENFMPYQRDENLVRAWAIPGTKNLEHRIGGLEKEDISGNVSYDAENHQHMVLTRAEKINKIAQFIPDQEIELGKPNAKVLILGWGSTYGVIKSVVNELINEDKSVAQIHIRHLHPFPKNLKTLLSQFDKIVIPELNNGQLSKIIKSEFLLPVIEFHQIKGIPIANATLKSFILSIY